MKVIIYIRDYRISDNIVRINSGLRKTYRITGSVKSVNAIWFSDCFEKPWRYISGYEKIKNLFMINIVIGSANPLNKII